MPPEAISLLEGSCLKEAAVQLEPDVLQTLDSLYAFYHRQDTFLEKGLHLSSSSGNQRWINGRKGIWLVRIHTTSHSREAISTEQACLKNNGFLASKSYWCSLSQFKYIFSKICFNSFIKQLCLHELVLFDGL